ncbi:tail fiber protein [Bradyrhizobium sp. 4]|nr:tail fiber protein [Bradyrhizobium sp. 39]MCK1751265.1 tail fiber protein [Bradyrhizobium sp. 135]UPJ38796.1 tail fiber protein [Bradyrhizobium sp. 4]
MSSFRKFLSKAAMNGAEVAFTVHATNGANPTLNVDGLGGDTIIIDTASGITPVPPGTLITGGVYSAVYYNTGNNWRLKDFYQLPFTVPIGGMIDYFGISTPSSNFVFPFGQNVSRTTYAALFALFGTAFGVGDGSTTFGLPDLRGRVTAGADNMGGSAAGRLTDAVAGIDSLGDAGGAQSRTLITANLPPYTPSGALSISNGAITINGAVNYVYSDSGGGGLGGGGNFGHAGYNNLSASQAASTGTLVGVAQGGTSTPVLNVQPTIVVNKLLRII